MRLNLGAGPAPIAGYENWDRKQGQEAFPLAVPDGSVAEIRASHLLEHFSHTMIGTVLADWVRALEPGGILKIAVPDFEKIVASYQTDPTAPVQQWLMGGQIDRDDFHGSVFDAEGLEVAMRAAGLVDIEPWTSEADDCAALPVSLNRQGRKRRVEEPLPMKVMAVISTPRLGFMDHFMACFAGLVPLGISLARTTGAFWGQCLERGMEQALSEGATHVLTLDYDTLFHREDVAELMRLARVTGAPAIAALQTSRHKGTPLFTVAGADGRNVAELDMDLLAQDLLKVRTAHFGLTLISAETLGKLPRPWFKAEPGSDGRWGEDRTDDDIWFWRQMERAGIPAYVAPRVVVGHLELMVRWPGRDLDAIHQHPAEWHRTGKPADAWR